ncbi:DUF2628 domain-containing protein [Variovorax sp. GB1P17]|uniref:DUF2628 domain-containing protein n=1 Tax=Variovorax sp. GB1P17 TaxID=3443740 RepID=UPI003F465FCD
MKRYQIFKHPSGDIAAIPEGWNWMAFLFGGLWALFNSMWSLGFGVIVGVLAFDFVGNLLVGPGASIFVLLVACAISWTFGSNGNEWLAKKLYAAGYELVEAVTASSAAAALVLAFPKAQPSAQDEDNP